MKGIPPRLALCLAIIGLTALGCGAGQNHPEDASAVDTKFEKEPEVHFSKFSVLTKGTDQMNTPYLLTFDGSPVDEVCFQPVRGKKVWKTHNPDILQKLNDNDGEVEEAIIAWFKENLLPEDFKGDLDLEASYKDAIVDHTSLDKLRLDSKQQCIDGATGGFFPGTRTITTQFGAKKFDFKSDSPVEGADMRSIRKSARKVGCNITAKLFDYPKAMGLDGKRRKDEKGKRLFEGPNGNFIRKADIPPPGKRPSFEWSVSCKKPVYFAVGEIVEDGWAKEISPEKCSVNLIYSDPVPRIPECKEFKETGFGIEESRDENYVTVKVTTDGRLVKKDILFGERVPIEVGGRVVVWVVPERIVAGALLHVDSFVLEPNTVSEKDLSSWPRRGRGRR